MKPRTIRKYRALIAAPDYWQRRLKFVTSEARWYAEEYAIRHHSWDLKTARAFERKIPWYKKKANATNSKA